MPSLQCLMRSVCDATAVRLKVWIFTFPILSSFFFLVRFGDEDTFSFTADRFDFGSGAAVMLAAGSRGHIWRAAGYYSKLTER